MKTQEDKLQEVIEQYAGLEGMDSSVEVFVTDELDLGVVIDGDSVFCLTRFYGTDPKKLQDLLEKDYKIMEALKASSQYMEEHLCITQSEFADKAAMAIGYDDPETGALIVPASYEKIASWYDEWKTSGLPIWKFAHSKIKS